MPYQLPNAVQDRANGIDIRVDPRIELLAIIQSLSAYATQLPFLLNRGDLPYRAEVQTRFGVLADHGAITWFDRISLQPGMYNFGAPPTSMLYLDQDWWHPRLRRISRPLPHARCLLPADCWQGCAANI